jgi:hypothetical protein
VEGKQVNGFNHQYQLFSSVFVIWITAVTSSHPNWSVYEHALWTEKWWAWKEG